MRYKDHSQSCTISENKLKIRDCQRHLGSSAELQHSDYLQNQKYFTLALLVLLVTNIMSGDDDGDSDVQERAKVKAGRETAGEK